VGGLVGVLPDHTIARWRHRSHRQTSGWVIVTQSDRRTRWLERRKSRATLVARCARPLPRLSRRAPYLTDTRSRSGAPARCSCAPLVLPVVEAFIFAAGASAGFYLVDQLLRILASATPDPAKPINRYEQRVLAGAFDWIAVGAALGAVSLLDGIHGWLPWMVGPSPRLCSTCSSRALSWLSSLSETSEFSWPPRATINHRYDRSRPFGRAHEPHGGGISPERFSPYERPVSDRPVGRHATAEDHVALHDRAEVPFTRYSVIWLRVMRA
jgi:hypothetical protein